MAICTEPFIKCFIERTRENLNNYQGNFEVTQLINSLLGLFVFPAEKYFHNNVKKEYKQQIEKLLNEYEISLNTLPQSISQIELYDYFRKLRNGIAHAHIKLMSSNSDNYEIDKLKIWNIHDSNIKDFEVIFNFKSADNIGTLIEKFSNFLENIFIYELFDNVTCIDFKYKSNKRIIAIYDKHYECCSFEFYENSLICLSTCKTKGDTKCEYFIDERVLKKVVKILQSNFNTNSKIYKTECKINCKAIKKIFWEKLQTSDFAIVEDSIYLTNLPMED